MRRFKVLYILISLVLFRIALFVLPFQELREFKERPYSVKIFDRNGRIIQILALDDGLRREYTKLSDIPKEIQKEFIKAEDKRFYFHFGIDLISVTRAFFQNLKDNRKVSGASTITMQLARMISPSENRGMLSKIKDSINAIRIEGKLSKKQILELYLNNIPFGKNSEGVTTASRTFYEKELTELTTEEIETLSKIPRNPSIYNKLQKKYKYPFEMPHYVSYLIQTGILKTENVTQKSEYTSTVDLRLQRFTEEKIREALRSAQGSRIANAAVLVMNSKTGEILSWIGSEGWNDNENSGQIDGVLNKMQPGSSMKPFLYALALESGFSPTDILADIPSEYGNKNLYIPQNFNNRFNGPVRFRVALASSLNIPAVTLLDKISVPKYLETLEKLGFDSLKGGGERYNLGLALGAGEVTLKELVDAFRVFVCDGIHNNTKIYSRDTARILCSILSDKNARSMGFGYSQTFETKYPAIFKTGTSNQYQNIVALGSTKNFTVGVWMGNFSGNTVIGKTGSSLPAFVAKSILDYLEQNTDFSTLSFEEPEQFQKQKVCSLSGMKPNKYCKNTVFEYVKEDSELKTCVWHTSTATFYPEEYQRWLSKNQNEETKIEYKNAPLSIKSPKEDGIFYFDSSRQKLRQFIPFEAEGGDCDSAELFLDGEKIQTIFRPFLLNLPMKKGSHELSIKCGEEEAIVRFMVN